MSTTEQTVQRKSRTPLQVSGFTIVELLVVIVVIAILAAISIVAYTGIQQQARDAQRRSDLANISKMLNLHATQNNGEMFGAGSGCGAHGNGNGWWESREEAYAKSTRQCLVDAGFNSAASINDPSGCIGGSGSECIGRPRYLIVHCVQGESSSVFIVAQLETEPQDPTFTDDICPSGSMIHGFANNISDWDTTYGVNYAVQVR